MQVNVKHWSYIYIENIKATVSSLQTDINKPDNYK